MPELFHYITILVLLYLECYLIQGDLNLPSDVMDNIWKHCGAMLNDKKATFDGIFTI